MTKMDPVENQGPLWLYNGDMNIGAYGILEAQYTQQVTSVPFKQWTNLKDEDVHYLYLANDLVHSNHQVN